MTECERIIEKGVIPRSFLEEETRNDFLVTTKRKKIWAIELDLFFEIIRICNKYQIKYWLAGGNLLGTVRHQGFIPWDDDIDILLFRKDYERFCEVCPGEMRDPYFFQTVKTERDCWFNFARVCNSHTTGIRKAVRGKQVNKGIFVDIIPLDALSNNQLARRIQQWKVKMGTMIANAYSFNLNKSLLPRLVHRVLHHKPFHFDIQKWSVRVNRCAGRENWEKAKQIGIVVSTPYRIEKVTWNKEDFSGTIEMPFEFFSVQVPNGWQHILTVQFGDYMKFPLVEQRGGWHDIIFDPDTQYIDYCAIHKL